jgi:hypothetical protein
MGFLIGVLSSWAFWYLQMRSKPKIVISSFCVFNPSNGGLQIKVRNEKRNQATDIQTSLTCVERKPNGKLLTLKIAQLRRDFLPALAPIQDLQKAWGIPATIVFATDDGREMIHFLRSSGEGERRFVFTLSATDGLSGAKIVQQVTYTLDQVKEGTFGLGFQLDAISLDDDDNN